MTCSGIPVLVVLTFKKADVRIVKKCSRKNKLKIYKDSLIHTCKDICITHASFHGTYFHVA